MTSPECCTGADLRVLFACSFPALCALRLLMNHAPFMPTNNSQLLHAYTPNISPRLTARRRHFNAAVGPGVASPSAAPHANISTVALKRARSLILGKSASRSPLGSEALGEASFFRSPNCGASYAQGFRMSRLYVEVDALESQPCSRTKKGATRSLIPDLYVSK